MTIGTTFSGDYVLAGGESSDTISFMGAADAPFAVHAAAPVDNSFWDNDGISLTGNPHPSPDTITFSLTSPGEVNDSMPPWGHSDHEFLINESNMSENRKQKYSEDVIIKELKDYITRTYDQHYSAGDDKIQTLDLIEACGDGEAFCRSNILKYASRYDKKGTARRDIMKILHYAVLLMHFNDKNAQRETYPQ